jgi:hypothetical protein
MNVKTRMTKQQKHCGLQILLRTLTFVIRICRFIRHSDFVLRHSRGCALPPRSGEAAKQYGHDGPSYFSPFIAGIR